MLPTRRVLRGAVRRPFRAVDPAAWLGPRRWRGPVPRPLVFLCVYRARHARTIAEVVEQAVALGADVRLWALDAVEPALEAHTLGSGPGLRTELQNWLWAARPADPDATVVLCDDDIVFTRADLAELLRATAAAGFDLAQATHGPGGHRGWPITHSQALTLARHVTWIESGPLLVVGPRCRDRVLPYPDGYGMGWGIELLWHDLSEDGFRLGMIDAVAIDHLTVAGADYDVRPERARVRALLEAHGGAHADRQMLLGTWRPWQRRPPWVA